MGDSIPAEYAPRLCHVVKWPEFQGYGFNLHAEKGKAGQFIGKVDDNSPAEAAGLRDGDRIVEVNGTNIGNENHQQVVSRIKSGGDETRMLVVSPQADSWFKEQKRVIKGDLPEVQFASAARNVPAQEEQTVEEPAAPEVVPEPEPEVIAAPVNGVNGDADHRPRLCHLKLWPTFQGYGFNLHAERDKPGQYIGLVDDDSPASTAGLQVNDRIVEVNGDNIEQATHQEVIAKIKAVQGETKLLVVDRETDLYYREKGVNVSSSMAHTHYIVSPDGDDAPAAAEAVNGDAEVAEEPVEEPVVSEEAEVVEAAAPVETQEVEEEPVSEPEEEPVVLVAEPVAEPEPEPEPVYNEPEPVPEPEPVVAEPEPEPVAAEPEAGLNGVQPAHEPAPAPVPVKSEAPKPKQQITTQPLRSNEPDILGGGLSVAEMKERLRQKKKPDPRMAKMSFEQKYKDFQKL